MDGFVFCAAVPTVVRVWEATVVDEAYRRVNPAYFRARSTGESVCSNNTAERVLSRGIVMEGQERPLLCFG